MRFALEGVIPLLKLTGWRKYLVLSPIVYLLLSSFFFMYASKEIQNSLMQEKYFEIVHAVDMLAAAVEANPDKTWQDHERNIVDSVEYLDRLYQVYAAAFEPANGELIRIICLKYNKSTKKEQ